MLAIPNTKQIINAGTSTGAIGVGLIVGKILQSTVMKNAEGKGFIPDNLITNIAAMAVLAIGSILVPNKFASLVLAATAGYFLIRSVNKGTEKLSGLGSITGGVKDFLAKYVPQLGEADEELNGSSLNMLNYGYGNITEPALLPPAEMEMNGMQGLFGEAEPVDGFSNVNRRATIALPTSRLF
ncbi:MAG: hypothetical protein PSX81_02705 [bacterium]|nr:hypothetical protein [bacterium]